VPGKVISLLLVATAALLAGECIAVAHLAAINLGHHITTAGTGIPAGLDTEVAYLRAVLQLGIGNTKLEEVKKNLLEHAFTSLQGTEPWTERFCPKFRLLVESPLREVIHRKK
jgi:hypothetical protein